MLTKPPFAASRALRFYDRRQSPRTTDELALTQTLESKGDRKTKCHQISLAHLSKKQMVGTNASTHNLRRRWGWQFAVAIIGTQALGDIVNILYGHTIQGAVGVMIASALLFYMTRPSIRGCFVAMPKQIVRSQDP